ncbi:MAG: DUF4340 domain-containing protein [Clostridia bacterium]|nr:DUF4340 domain-containing protein [Clostridia bacterium]
MKKKSYLSRQMIAVIVIASVLLVSIPLYFFVLVPFLERGKGTQEVAAPFIEGESVTGSTIAITTVNDKEGESVKILEYTLGKGGESWKLKTSGDIASVVGYENTPFTDNVYYLYNAVKRPTASERIAPSIEELTEIREQKAAKMSAQELEEMGGIGKIAITEEDLADYQINWADYGLDNKDELNYYTVTDVDGVTHTLYIGATAADGSSRYAMLEGRKAVYLLNGSISRFLCMTTLELARPLVLTVPEDATSNYTPDSFVIYREGVDKAGDPYVRIERIPAEQALLLDKTTTSVIVEYVGEPGKEDQATSSDYNYYNTNTTYMQMLYEFFRANIEGSEVVHITPSYAEISQGQSIYKQDPIPEETLAEFFINKENPYRSFYYSKETKQGDMMNLIVFSTPQKDEENKTFYYVYNANYEMIVKVYDSSLPTIGAAKPVSFIEADYTEYLNKYVSILALDSVVGVNVDSTKLPSNYAQLMPALKEKFNLNYKMNAVGDDRVLDEDGLPTLQSVTLSNGSALKDVNEKVTGEQNFREMYARLVSIRMYTNVEHMLEGINNTDLNTPHVTVTYQIYKGATHTLNFYMFDPSGTYAFYTYDGQGKYVVYREDVTEFLQAVECLQKGESVKDVLGDAF